jgi:hypothetical protein
MESLLALSISLMLLTPSPVKAQNIAPTPPTSPAEQCLSESCIKSRIHYFAEKYGVSEITMNIAISCEANYNPNAIGDNGNSFGLAQIFLPAHPDITKEMALDPDFSLDFMAKNLKERNHSMWTCLKNN